MSRDRLIFSSLLVLLIAQILFNPLIVYATAPIYIVAVQTTGGTGHTDEDFVELFNPNDTSVNLKGFRLVKRAATSTSDTSLKSWTTDAVIPAHAFFLWANSSFTATAPDVASSGTLSDDNGVALRQGAEDTGIIIDSVAWGKANNTFNNVSSTNPKANQSLLRQNLYASSATYSIVDNHQARNSAIIDSSSNSSTSTPAVCPAPDPTPPAPTVTPAPDPAPQPTPSPTTPAPDPAPAAPASAPATSPASTTPAASESVPAPNEEILEVTISELLPNPTGTDSGAEMVELHNSGSQPAHIQGWSLNNQKAAASGLYTFGDLTVPASGYLAVTIPKGYFSMVNTGDSIGLYDSTHQLADQVAYSGSAPEGKSYQKVGERWLWGDPSFGSENKVSATPLVATTAATTKTAPAKATTTKATVASISSAVVKQLKSQIAKLGAAIDIMPDPAAAQQDQSTDLNVSNSQAGGGSTKRRLIELGIALVFVAIIIWAALKAYRASKEE